MHSLAAYFFVSPGCRGIGLAVEHRRPVVAVPQPIRNVSIFFPHGISACYKPQRNNVWYTRPLLPQRGQGPMPLVGCRGETPHRLPALQRETVWYTRPLLPQRGPGAMPLVGCRGETPHRLPTLQREIACSPNRLLPQKGPGAMPLVGCRGETPHDLPSNSGRLPVRQVHYFRKRVKGRWPL